MIYPNVASSDADTHWPESGLEKILKCPVCGGHERSALYNDLVDNIFYTAPGKWSSWRCLKCRCSYLDPRPSRASIHRAYGKYYTHKERVNNTSYTKLNLIANFAAYLRTATLIGDIRLEMRQLPFSAFHYCYVCVHSRTALIAHIAICHVFLLKGVYY